jgi:type I restriction enzyme R subunit
VNEAQTRKNLIDNELKQCGWDISDPLNVIEEYEIELDDNLPQFFDRTKRFVDYALLNKTGQIIALVEAKKETKSVGSAKTQAEYYARRIKNVQGFAPFIYITNGHEIEFWDSENYPIRKVLDYHSLEDLETYRKRNENNIILSPELLNKEIAGRYYQFNAIAKSLEELNTKHRSLLWVMATGTGKTRTVIALIDILLRTGFVKRVLFLADRKELVRQAIDNFKEHLPDQSRQKIETKHFEKDRRVYASTYQTMMSLLQKSDISQGFFDLIIADESHRSIYNYYGDIFTKFDAIKLGLTATPIDFIDRNTFLFFGTEKGNPTFAYTYEEAIGDEYLCDYEVMSVRTKFQEEGIQFEMLTEEERAKLKNSGYEEEDIKYEGSQIERMVINDDTNKKLLTTFMENCYYHPITNLPSKTIIFAVSKKHAYRLEQHFNELFPQYHSKVAKVIVSELNNTEELINEFKDVDSGFNIAISVDMLDTGIDVPSIMNLVFAKPVFSRAKFWQMIGRGTRLYDEAFQKEKFVIFDFWGNFEYFNEQPEGYEPKEQPSLPRKIFNENIKLIKLLNGDEIESLKTEIKAQIEALPKDDYFIKSKATLISKINDSFYDNIKSNIMLLGQISELIDRLEVKDPQDLQFRVKTKKLQNAKLNNDAKVIERVINSILKDIEKLRVNKSITAVEAQIKLLNKAANGQYWAGLDFEQTNEATDIIAPLMKYKSKNDINVGHFNFEDFIDTSAIGTMQPLHSSIDLKAYKDHILKVIQRLVNESPALQELFVFGKVSDDNLIALKDELLQESIETEKLSEMFECKSSDLVEIFKKIIHQKEYKLPHLLDEFLKTHTLSSNQIEFIKAVKHFIQEKRNITRKDLMENPFTKFHKMGVMGMFKGSVMNELVEIIDDKKEA